VFACVSILTGDAGGKFVPALSVDVPAGRHIGAGDLDGDGHADLAGTGETLWTALSSRRARSAGPPVLVAPRPTAAGVVINELLAINNDLPLASDDGRKADWLELWNGGSSPRSLSGWKLVLAAAGALPGATVEYRFPPQASIPPAGHLVLVHAESVRTPFHTGFRLPGEGGTLTLLDETGATADRVEYPPQRANISYARYRDGVHSLVFNNFPSPGLANADNGPVPPLLELEGAWSIADAADGSRRLPAPGEPIRFFARAEDDVAVVSASILYQWIDGRDPALHRIILYDDGMHGDGEMQDGLLAGVLETGLPADAEIRLRIEASDLSDHVTVVPDGGGPGGDDDAPDGYTFSLSAPRGLEISEVVPLNETGLRDEQGGTPDWVEIRNCSGVTVALDKVFLGERFPADDDWFAFPAGSDLAPGEHLVVACDGNPEQGPFHAPFKLDAAGGHVFLVGTGPGGGHGIIDHVAYGPQAADQAHARQGCGGDWVTAPPTPGAANGIPVARGDVDRSGRLDMTDPIQILSYLFLAGGIACLGAADVTGDAQVNITDPIHLLAHLFLSGPPPVEGPTGCTR
jgi:hypothetical protein